MHHLEQLFLERIYHGIKKKTLTKCSKWAEEYRVVGGSFPGRWTFKYHPWERDMHDSNAETNIGQKSSQMGFTDTVLNKVFFKIDIFGTDCLYVLPAKTPDASDFSAGRFNPALELSQHLSNLFSDVKNVGHKRAGSANLYIRGARSRGGLKSIPAGFLVLDELDEMPKENITLAFERTSGQLTKEKWLISTPTVPRFGIHEYFRNSTQNHYYFPCPSCNRYIEFRFPESIVITADSYEDPSVKNSHLICYECKNKLPHEGKYIYLQKGCWQPNQTNKDDVGWYVNHLYSPTVTPVEIAEKFLHGQYDASKEQEFYNSDLGLPHAVEGASVTDNDIKECIKPYKSSDIVSSPGGIITMGVDVGNILHYEIDQWQLGNGVGADLNLTSKCRIIKFGRVHDFDELVLLMDQYGVRFCVIDAQPERRKATEFAMRCFGRVRLCFYGMGVQGKLIHLSEDNQCEVTVDRTAWLDLSLGRFRGRTIALPSDIDFEYCNHIKAPVRVYDYKRATETRGLVDKKHPFGRYVTSLDDHYAHARNYAEIALPLAVSIGTSQTISRSVL